MIIKSYKKVCCLCENFVIYLITLYKKWISPFLPCACRFQPTCSEYMIQAIRLHGLFKGGYLGVKRLLRCHPWGGRGFDPVPMPDHEHIIDKDTD